MFVLHLTLLTFLWIASATDLTQADFNGAIQARELESIKCMLLLADPSDIDPSVNECEVLYLACDAGDHDLVKMLLEDERVNPALKNNKALSIAAKSLYHEVCILLLRDSRVPAGLIHDTPWVHQVINPSFIREIRNIPRNAFEACATGNVDLIRNNDLATLDLNHLDLLLQRSEHHIGVRKRLHREQLRLLGAPHSVFSNQEILQYVVNLNTRSHVVIKGALLLRSHISMVFRKLPVEVVSIIANLAHRKLLYFPLFADPPRKTPSKTALLVWPPLSLLSFMAIDTSDSLSLDYPILKWVGRALTLWNIVSLCLAMLPFNNFQTDGLGHGLYLSYRAFKIMTNFLIFIAVYLYIFA